MGTAFDFFLKTGPGVQAVYRMGFLPCENDFREMTEDEYAIYLQDFPDRINSEIYVLWPEEKIKIAGGKVCINELELDCLMRGVTAINNLTEGKGCHSDEEKLQRAAKTLPNVFTRGTRFERGKEM
ncbi:MAG: hypothetical protein E7097_01380 [Bacteroides sp.]|nr:hypothetical protein [Bacteroides sp.]